MFATVETPPLLPQRHFSFDAAVTGLAFMGLRTLAIALGDGSLRLVATADESAKIIQPHEAKAAILTLALDIDDESVLTGGDDGRLARATRDGEVTILAEFPGQQVDVIATSAAAGLRAVAAGREVRLIDRSGRAVASTADHPSTIGGLAFNPKGKRLAVAHYDGVTLWWTGKLGQSPSRLHWRGSHIGLTWSPDGTVVLTAMQECELHGWRLTDAQHIRMTGYAAKVRAMDWLARPMTLVTSGVDCVTAWNFKGAGPMGKPPIEIAGGIGRLVTSIALHPKKWLVAAGFDDGQAIISPLEPQGTPMRLRKMDRQRITALAWSRDGRWLAAGAEQGAVSLIDCRGGIPA